MKKKDEIYKRVIKFHDTENMLVTSELIITTRNGYNEFTMCNERAGCSGQSEFFPKDGYQTELHIIWGQYHLNGMGAGLPIQMKAITEWEKQGNKYDYKEACEYLKSINLYEVDLKSNLPENMFITGKETIQDGETYKYGHGLIYCNLPEDFEETLDELCDNIEEEESNRFEDSIEDWDNILDDDGNLRDEVSNLEDEKIIALSKHLGITPTMAHNDIIKISDCLYSYSGTEYLVCTDDEADKREREAVENTIEECYLGEITRQMKDNPVLNYIDMDRWIKDWCGDRGNNLNYYDGCEDEEEVNGTTYYIYRN